MPEVVTYLEMTSSDELNAAPSIPEVSIERAHTGSPLIRELTERVGRPCGWRTVSWSDQKWAEFLANPDVQAWLITHKDGRAGLQHLGVWLHTSTLDHPNALPNYQKRGFRPYHSYIREP
jgi:hypothetical protein